MLRSVVIRLVSLDAARTQATHGHHAHALFMALIRQADPELAQRLHDLNGEKPFTVSPLLEERRRRHQKHQPAPGQEYSLRFTLLSEVLFGTLMERFLKPGNHVPVSLGGATFAVAGIDSSATGNGWAAAIDETALLAGAQPGAEIQLEFATPTSFSRGARPWGRSVDLLPTPTNVFDSLARRWNTLVAQPKGLPPVDLRQLSGFVGDHVMVSRLERVETRALRFSHGLQLGFCGLVAYTVQGVTGTGAEANSVDQARIVDWLGDFAFYSGVGSKTTMGMGQVRRLRRQARLAAGASEREGRGESNAGSMD